MADAWWSLQCRSTILDGRHRGLRCRFFRWHFGPHQGGDIHGPCWMTAQGDSSPPRDDTRDGSKTVYFGRTEGSDGR